MRIVGILYLFLFVAATFLQMPIRAEGPDGMLDQLAAGDPTARFAVDTWVTLGLLLGVIGSGLLMCSRAPERSMALVWTVIGGELAWGIGSDIYKIVRGYAATLPVIWILIHLMIIFTGLYSLRSSTDRGAGS